MLLLKLFKTWSDVTSLRLDNNCYIITINSLLYNTHEPCADDIIIGSEIGISILIEYSICSIGPGIDFDGLHCFYYAIE